MIKTKYVQEAAITEDYIVILQLINAKNKNHNQNRWHQKQYNISKQTRKIPTMQGLIKFKISLTKPLINCIQSPNYNTDKRTAHNK